MFHIIVSVNNDDLPKLHWPVRLCNGDYKCLLCGRSSSFKYLVPELRAYRSSFVSLLLSYDQDARAGLVAPNFKQEKSHIKRICKLNRILPCKKSERYQIGLAYEKVS